MPEQHWAAALSSEKKIESSCEKDLIKSPRGRRVARQFLPLEWSPISWDVLGSARRFFGFNVTMIVMNTIQITTFFMKFILYLGPEDQLNKYRIFFWMLLGAPFVRELIKRSWLYVIFTTKFDELCTMNYVLIFY